MSRQHRQATFQSMRTFSPLLAVALATGGCSVNRVSGPPMPTALAPVSADQVRTWVAESSVDAGQMVRIRWSFLEEGATAKGRGTAWLIPPDSLRFDFRGPLGSGSGAAVVVGDQEQWSEPEEEFRKLVPKFSLLWAILGSARPPVNGADLTGLDDGRLAAWRSVNGADTVDYVWVRSPARELVADVRDASGPIGRVHTRFDAEGMLQSARLDIPARPARLELEFYGHRSVSTIADSLWLRPTDGR